MDARPRDLGFHEGRRRTPAPLRLLWTAHPIVGRWLTWRAIPAGPSAVVQPIKAGGFVRYGAKEEVGTDGSFMETYGLALGGGNIGREVRPVRYRSQRHPAHFEPLSLESNGIV